MPQLSKYQAVCSPQQFLEHDDNLSFSTFALYFIINTSCRVFWRAGFQTAQPIIPIHHTHSSSASLGLPLTCHSPVCIFVFLDKLSFQPTFSSIPLSALIKRKEEKNASKATNSMWQNSTSKSGSKGHPLHTKYAFVHVYF